MTAVLALSDRGINSFAQFATVIIIFIFVLGLAYLTTRFIAKYEKNQIVNKNIEIIETFRLSTNKFIAIVRVGEKYLALAIGKDTVTMLTELNADDLNLVSSDQVPTETFQEILNKAKNLIHKK
ncbi:MAG: flagellar biosynthetic protein FliO [Fibrobacter sp.]|nr:flagellar biosynthetic protein FliO [Fibrobacter sp.]